MDESLESKFTSLKAKNLKIDLTRGKPGADQLDLSNLLLTNSVPCESPSGVDVRNYGHPLGIHEARELGAEIMSATIENTLVGEQSSLLLIYQLILANYLFGLVTPWKDQDDVAFICPVPGFDRHFRLLDDFGIKMLPVPLTGSGVDIEKFKELIEKNKNIKGIMCVPRHSNPSGDIYSDENISEILQLGKEYSSEFLFIFDNAYLVHDFSPSKKQTPVWDLAKKHNVLDQTAIFCSFSKVTFGSGGLSFAAAGTELFNLLVRQRTSMIVSADKVNQLRHIEFFKNKDDVLSHMKKHADLVRPKFEVAYAALDSLDSTIGYYQKPTGGYFISYNTTKPIAKRVIALCEEAGVLITPAGSTYPHFEDPKDSNIRLAPTFLDIDNLKEAMEVFTTALQIASKD